MPDPVKAIQAALSTRFEEQFEVDATLPGLDEACPHRIPSRHPALSAPRDVSPGLLRLLCACALRRHPAEICSRRDILVVREIKLRARARSPPTAAGNAVGRHVAGVSGFSLMRRGCRFIAHAHGTPFPNDHLDLFFNASVDTPAIVLATFMAAAEAVGLGCCPISVIRDHADTVSRLLQASRLKSFRSPACVSAGRPKRQHRRARGCLPGTTLHEERFEEGNLGQAIGSLRPQAPRGLTALPQPARRRSALAHAEFYGWSRDPFGNMQPAAGGFRRLCPRIKRFHLDWSGRGAGNKASWAPNPGSRP